jgi:hypothetical protein
MGQRRRFPRTAKASLESFAAQFNTYAVGAGFTIAVAWNCLEIFGSHLMQAGAVIFWSFLHTGQVQHLETMMVLVGGSAISFS